MPMTQMRRLLRFAWSEIQGWWTVFPALAGRVHVFLNDWYGRRCAAFSTPKEGCNLTTFRNLWYQIAPRPPLLSFFQLGLTPHPPSFCHRRGSSGGYGGYKGQ